MRSECKHALVRKSLQRCIRCLIKSRLWNLWLVLLFGMTWWPRSQAPAQPCNLPTFCVRGWVWKGCDRCTSFSELMWCLYRVCTEAQKKAQKNSRWSERWKTRAPRCPTSFQTYGVVCNRWNTRFENLGQISEKFRFILQMSEISKEYLE